MRQELIDKLNQTGLLTDESEISIDDGWYDLVAAFCAIIADHVKYSYPTELQGQIKVVQMKEKFGTLRIHIYHSDDYIMGAVSMAEYHSSVICEVCGHPGTLHNVKGWQRTLCEKDFKKALKAAEKRLKAYQKKILKNLQPLEGPE